MEPTVVKLKSTNQTDVLHLILTKISFPIKATLYNLKKWNVTPDVQTLSRYERYERKHDACKEKITTQKQICVKEAYVVPEKEIKQQSQGNPERHKRDKQGKELRKQCRI